MEGLGKIGDVVRNHYEKLILGLALLGLAVAVVVLMRASQAEQVKIQAYLTEVERRSGTRVKPADLTRLEGKLKEAQSPPALEISGAHNLINPVRWQRRADGGWIKKVEGTEGTLDELEIVRIAPLQLVMAVDKFTGNGYTIAITNEATIPPYPKVMKPFLMLNETNKPMVILREIKGTPENPELVLEIKDTGERVAISKENPLVRTNTYEVDLRWKVEDRSFKRQRTNAVVNLGGEVYKIVAINPGEIVMSASNDKKYTVRQPSAP